MDCRPLTDDDLFFGYLPLLLLYDTRFFRTRRTAEEAFLWVTKVNQKVPFNGSAPRTQEQRSVEECRGRASLEFVTTTACKSSSASRVRASRHVTTENITIH